jgi:asparagine synthase (glutamine-hydrolysing)
MSDIFGFLKLGATPIAEPALDPLPVRHAASGCLILADARIDYRGDLCEALALDPAAVGDAELILAAYLRWGEACLDHFLGDFAFAIWDARDSKLFCARDHFGMRPFYYHHVPGARFVFASDARAVFAVPEVPYAINEGRVADFLVPELEWIDYTSTFYEQVYRLPPGHKLTVTPGRLDVAEYWAPTPGPEPAIKSDREWVDAFLEVFSRAIAERLRAPAGQVGCMLSGGMDSGSTAALARDLLASRGAGPLRSFSAAQGPDVDCDETRRIHATVEKLHARATILQPDGIAYLDRELVASIEEPFDAGFLFMKAIFRAAGSAGLTVLLDGGGGDVVFNEGSYLTRLIRRGQFSSALREIRAESSFWGGDHYQLDLIRHLLRAVTPEPVKRASRPWRQRAEARRFVSTSLISRDFAAQVNIAARCERMYAMFPANWTADAALERVRKIRPNVAAGRERYRRLAASAGVEARDPFLDLKVVGLCVHLPGQWLQRDGWPTFILREAMAGKLPDDVRWGRGKPHVGWVFNKRFLERERSRGNLSLERLESSLQGRVDRSALARGWESLVRGGDFEPVSHAYVLSLWLEQTANRRVVKNHGFT